MVKIKNIVREENRPPVAVVPHRCMVCKLTFNHRQRLSRHYKKQHRLPSSWETRETRTLMEPSVLPASASLPATLTASSSLQTSAEPSVIPVSAAPSLTQAAEQAAESQPETSAAEWAEEAAAAVMGILQRNGAEDDLSSTPGDTEEEEPVAAVRAMTTREPAKKAPRKDFRGGPVVDFVTGGWEEPAPVATPDLFSMIKELSGRPAPDLASVIERRYRQPSPERRQLRRLVAAMAYGYRQAQQEVRNLLPVGSCAEEDVWSAWRSIAAWAAMDTMPAPRPCE